MVICKGRYYPEQNLLEALTLKHLLCLHCLMQILPGGIVFTVFSLFQGELVGRKTTGEIRLGLQLLGQSDTLSDTVMHWHYTIFYPHPFSSSF